MMSETGLNEGAFAFVDCLGFKGIWGRHPARMVIDKLICLETVVEEECSKYLSRDREMGFDLIMAKVSSISDGVALSVHFQDGSPTELLFQGEQLVGRLCMMMARIIDHFLIDEPHLLLRGCITYGGHLTAKTFLIGPAVDEAVEYEKIPNGAFIWLSPKAGELYDGFLSGLNSQYDNLMGPLQRA